jgi:predicted transcriptional regulator
MLSNALIVAQELLLPNGLAPLPVIAHTKRAAFPWGKWQAEGFAPAQLPLLFRDETLTVAAICGAASGNLVALDCDSPRAFETMQHSLDHPDTWIIQSQRGGHLYFRTPVPVRATNPQPDIQILGQGHYVMAPGALHPSGIPYAFLNHPPHIAGLQNLHALPGIVLEPVAVRPTGLPRLAWQILSGQTTKRDYFSDSEREFAAVCSMINAGFDFARIHTAFAKLATGKQTHFGRWMIERGGAKSAREMLERMYRSGLQFTAKDSAERVAAKQLRAWLLDHPLDGRTGTYDTCALDAILQMALQAGSLTVAASARDIAERAGVSKEAANKATRRLIERGWLVLDEEWRGRFANVYRIEPQSECGLQNLYTSIKELNVRECIGFATTENLFGLDAFRWQGIGKFAALVCVQLAQTPLTLDELSARLGKEKRSSISRAIEKLRAAGVIEPADGLRGWAMVWQLVRNLDWAAVARRLSTDGIGKRQKRDHIRERDQFRKRLDEVSQGKGRTDVTAHDC